LLVPLGVVRGVATGPRGSKAMFVAGLAEALTGSSSVDAGEFVPGRSEAPVRGGSPRSFPFAIAGRT